jgi:hypothetical protein
MRLRKSDREAGGRWIVGEAEWKRSQKGKGEKVGEWERRSFRTAWEDQ